MPVKRGLLERLNNNEPVIGDGGFVFAMEKRGYLKAGPWTPEASVEHPEALRQLHREFLRAGADVMQAYTFYGSDDKLENRGQKVTATGAEINAASCKIAREVAGEGDALFLGGICQTPTYLSGVGKEATQAIFKKQLDVFVDEKVDFILCEYFEHVEEMEWAIEVAKNTGLPVAASMCINAEGDLHDVSAAECAVRMVNAGADVIGINCHFDPFMCLEGMKKMKAGVEAAGLKTHYMVQPLAFMTPDASKQGFIDLPEFPFGLEPRICTRMDMHRFAREAYEMGILYIGGCCGFEPYHIRAVAEELAKERGKLPAGSEKHEVWGGALRMHTKPWVRARAQRSHWENLKPSSGRPHCSALSKPDAWGETQGDERLKQHAHATTEDEQADVIKRREK